MERDISINPYNSLFVCTKLQGDVITETTSPGFLSEFFIDMDLTTFEEVIFEVFKCCYKKIKAGIGITLWERGLEDDTTIHLIVVHKSEKKEKTRYIEFPFETNYCIEAIKLNT